MLCHSQAKRVLVVISCILAVAVLVVAIAYDNMEGDSQDPFWEQLAGSGMQVVVAATIGVGVTLLLDTIRSQEEKQQRDKDQQRLRLQRESDYRLDLLRQLRATYSEIKRVRRQLERAGFTPRATGPLTSQSAAIYTDGMETILRVKYQLEAFADELQAGMSMGPSSKEIEKHLYTMERYLKSRLIKEYVARSLVPVTNPGSLTFAQFPETKAFVDRAAVAFGPYLSAPYHQALRILVKENQLAASPPQDRPGDEKPSPLHSFVLWLNAHLPKAISTPYRNLQQAATHLSSRFPHGHRPG